MLAENVLHIGVGFNDTYLASHLPTAAAATAAVGMVTYVIWLLGLIAGAIGTGSTAIIARAKRAKHQRLANSVCGQIHHRRGLAGIAVASVTILFAVPIAELMGLGGQRIFSLYYLRVLALCPVHDADAGGQLLPARRGRFTDAGDRDDRGGYREHRRSASP